MCYGSRMRNALLGFLAAAALGISIVGCSASGGTGNVSPRATPTPTPTPFVFTGSSIVNNVMTLPCATNETFTVAEGSFAGTFYLTPSSVDLTVQPASGTSSTTFTAYTGYFYPPYSFTIGVTAGNGAGAPSGTLTVNVTTGDCG
jgi:hypothetical protein